MNLSQKAMFNQASQNNFERINFDLGEMQNIEKDLEQQKAERAKRVQQESYLAPPNEILDKNKSCEDLNYKVVLRQGVRSGYYKYGGLYLRDGTLPTGSFLERLEQVYRSKYQTVTLQQIFDSSNNLVVYDKFLFKKPPQRRRGFRFTTKDNRMPFQLLQKQFNIIKINEEQIKDKAGSLHIAYQTKEEQQYINNQLDKLQEKDEKQKENPQLKDTAIFDSKFESGNLAKVVKVGDFEYNLLLQNDINTFGYNYWFHFKVSNVKPDNKVVFNIVNFKKKTSLFNEGLEISIFSEKGLEKTKQSWFKGGEDIAYVPNGIVIPKRKKNTDQKDKSNNNSMQNSPRKQDKSKIKEDTYYTLRFQYTFLYEDDTVTFALNKPYTYNQQQAYIDQIKKNWFNKQFTKHKVLTKSLGGFNIDALTITSEKPENQVVKEKQAVLILARAHPGESVASYVMKGILDFLLMRDNELGELLRDNFIFKIIPMLNPDGVICGNHRCSLSGQDINRKWGDPNEQKYPEIFHSKQEIIEFNEKHNIKMVLDIHASTKKKFFSSISLENEEEPKNPRLFPYLLSKLNQNFKYSQCDYVKPEKMSEIEGTPLVNFYKEMNLENLYTIEASIQGTENLKDINFISRDYEDFGHSICLTLLLQYLENYDEEKLQKSYKSYTTQCFLQNFKPGDNFFNEMVNVQGDLIFNKVYQMHEFDKDYQFEVQQRNHYLNNSHNNNNNNNNNENPEDNDKNLEKNDQENEYYPRASSQIGTDSQPSIDNLSDLDELFPPPPPPPKEEEPDNSEMDASISKFQRDGGRSSTVRPQRGSMMLLKTSGSISPLKRMSSSISPLKRNFSKRGSVQTNMINSFSGQKSKQLNFFSRKSMKTQQTQTKNLEKFVQALQIQCQETTEKNYDSSDDSNQSDRSSNIDNRSPINSQQNLSPQDQSPNSKHHKKQLSSSQLDKMMNSYDKLKQFFDGEQNYSPNEVAELLNDTQNDKAQKDKFLTLEQRRKQQYVDGQLEKFKQMHFLKNSINQQQKNQQNSNSSLQDIDQSISLLKQKVIRKNAYKLGIQLNPKSPIKKVGVRASYDINIIKIMNVSPSQKSKNNVNSNNTESFSQMLDSVQITQNISQQQQNQEQEQDLCSKRSVLMAKGKSKTKREDGENLDNDKFCNLSSQEFYEQLKTYNLEKIKQETNQKIFRNTPFQNTNTTNNNSNSNATPYKQSPGYGRKMFSQQNTPMHKNNFYLGSNKKQLSVSNNSIDFTASVQNLNLEEQRQQIQQEINEEYQNSPGNSQNQKEVDNTITDFLKTKYYKKNIKPQLTYDMTNRQIVSREQQESPLKNTPQKRNIFSKINFHRAATISPNKRSQQQQPQQEQQQQISTLRNSISPRSPKKLKADQKGLTFSTQQKQNPQMKNNVKNLLVKTEFLSSSKQKFIPLINTQKQSQYQQSQALRQQQQIKSNMTMNTSQQNGMSPLKQRQMQNQSHNNQNIKITRQNSIQLLNSDIDRELVKTSHKKKQQAISTLDDQLQKEIQNFNLKNNTMTLMNPKQQQGIQKQSQSFQAKPQFESLGFPQKHSPMKNPNIKISKRSNFGSKIEPFSERNRPQTGSPVKKQKTISYQQRQLQKEDQLFQQIVQQFQIKKKP